MRRLKILFAFSTGKVYYLDMEFFEEMDVIEREIMILEAVQASVAIEGMEKAAEECQAKILKLREKQIKEKSCYLTTKGSNKLDNSQ